MSFYDFYKNKGPVLIFNHESYKPRLGLPPRRGTNIDKVKLQETFVMLGFDDIRSYDNLPMEIDRDGKQGIFDVVKSAAEEDHTHDQCFVVAILTHGSHGNWLWAFDQNYKLSELFDRCVGEHAPTLLGKPKIFIVQVFKNSH